MSSLSSVWYCLFDANTGQNYHKTTDVDFVELPPGSFVAHFRKAVHLDYSTILTGIAFFQLIVYKNKAAFDKIAHPNDLGGLPLCPSHPLDGLGESANTPLVVVVPSQRRTRPSDSDQKEKEPNSKRQKRWKDLNEIITAKKAKNQDSMACSNVTWNDVKLVFKPVNYVQARRPLDETNLTLLAKYLSMTTKVFGEITTGKDAKRLHFIAPILICVCILLEGKVDFVAEEDLVGSRVKAHCRFEFMITHEDKAVCIVEAKKDDMEQGMALDLLGCEVAAEVGGLDVVCGIVTNYIQWNFFRSCNDRVEWEECSMDLTPEGPEPASLKKIAEKIYGMLKGE